MFWVVLLIICGIVSLCLESTVGKMVFGSGVLAIGLLFLYWITGISLLITMAKICAIVIVVCTIGALLIAIIG